MADDQNNQEFPSVEGRFFYAPQDFKERSLDLLLLGGMPPDAERFALEVEGAEMGADWAEYKVQLFGILVSPEEVAEMNLVKEASFESKDGEGTGRNITFVPWLKRLMRAYTMATLEEIFNNKTGWEQIIRHLNDIPEESKEKEVATLLAGRHLLQFATEAIGRAGSGGDWRKQEIKNMWTDEDVLKNFARKVNELKPVWAAIKDMADPCDTAESKEHWVSEMLERKVIRSFMSQYPKLTKDVLGRTVDSSLKPVNRERRQLAFFHAALEVEVNINGETLSIIDAYLKYQDIPLSPISLKPYYDKGNTLLNPSE
jgi:hypothetical protein